jgi:predicted nucleic acid-binding protein
LIITNQPCISAITEIELLCWKTASENDIVIMHNFIQDALVIELECSVKLKTADLRKQYKIKLPDAIIAATALIYNLTLITRNTEDFKNIKDLAIIDVWKIAES